MLTVTQRDGRKLGHWVADIPYAPQATAFVILNDEMSLSDWHPREDRRFDLIPVLSR